MCARLAWQAVPNVVINCTCGQWQSKIPEDNKRTCTCTRTCPSPTSTTRSALWPLNGLQSLGGGGSEVVGVDGDSGGQLRASRDCDCKLALEGLPLPPGQGGMLGRSHSSYLLVVNDD